MAETPSIELTRQTVAELTSPGVLRRHRDQVVSQAVGKPVAGGSTIEVVLPAHNEGEGIGSALREFYQVASIEGGLSIRFIVCEDGSTDNTCDVVRKVAEEIPIRLISSPERKGYSRAVVDGFKATESDLVGFIDSDGQCDPADFNLLVDSIDGYDLVIGYRNPRVDSAFRKLMSAAFRVVYKLLFPIRLKDPSCPYLLIRREALHRTLQGKPGILRQGFWWEFNARAGAAGLRIRQVPVKHRVRTAGATQVYKLNKVPRIAIEHLRGLFVLRNEIRRLHHL
jgi:dolichol-phosphate mannosyltransferase